MTVRFFSFLLLALCCLPSPARASEMAQQLAGAESAVHLAIADLNPAEGRLRLRTMTVDRIVWDDRYVLARELIDWEAGLVEGREYWRVTFEVEGHEGSSFQVRKYVDIITNELVR